MKNTLFYSLKVWTVLCVVSALCAQAPEGYELYWADEFDGDTINEEDWAYRVGGKQSSYHKKENVSLENGKLKIDLLKEEGGEFPYSAGGLISLKSFGHGPGYHEVSVKISKHEGWHESFWTMPYVRESSAVDRNVTFEGALEALGDFVEFDVIEHYSSIGPREVTAGAIHWLDNGVLGERKLIIRKKPKLDFDLSENFHTFGVEMSSDYAIFYMDGEVLDLVDMRRYPFHPFHARLTCLAGSAPPAEDAAYYDYFRSYTISPEAYEVRRAEVMAILNKRKEAEAALRAQEVSSGTDLWMEVENFPELGLWIDRPADDTPFERTARAINGRGRKGEHSKQNLSARGVFDPEKSGEYRLWVRAWDGNTEGTEHGTFSVLVNGEKSKTLYGTHNKGGFAWQDGGVFKLEKGAQSVVIYDSDQNGARCDMVLLTTDLDFVPSLIGGEENVEYINTPSKLSSIEKFGW